MTYDFGTMEIKLEEQITAHTTINSQLIPLSVAVCVKTSQGMTTFSDKPKRLMEKTKSRDPPLTAKTCIASANRVKAVFPISLNFTKSGFSFSQKLLTNSIPKF
jgi:hypothetical protein